MLIATLKFGDDTAELDSAEGWTCSDATLAGALNVSRKCADRSPARGDWMRWHAQRMAGLLGAELDVEPAGVYPDRVY